jgi:hypothetical protein
MANIFAADINRHKLTKLLASIYPDTPSLQHNNKKCCNKLPTQFQKILKYQSIIVNLLASNNKI